jgi:hypothetical protein
MIKKHHIVIMIIASLLFVVGYNYLLLQNSFNTIQSEHNSLLTSLKTESVIPFQEYSINQIQNNWSYEGTIGESEVLMTIISNGSAEYIYKGVSKTVIPMIFKQSGDSSNVVFIEDISRSFWIINSKTLEGEWQQDSPENTKTLPIKLKKIPRLNVGNIVELLNKTVPDDFLQIDCVLDAQKSTSKFITRK